MNGSAGELGIMIKETTDTPLPRALRIVIADDHELVRGGIKTLVNREPDIQVVGEAASGEQLLQVVWELVAQNKAPDLVIVDVSMPKGDGIKTTAKIQGFWSSLKVLALSMFADRAYLRAMLSAGASGYLLKRSSATELIHAIRTVAAGGLYIDPALTGTVMQFIAHTAPASKMDEPSRAALSEREEMVLRLIAHGYSQKEIAAQLRVNVKTVDTYKRRAVEKLGIDGRIDIVRYANTQGWLG